MPNPAIDPSGAVSAVAKAPASPTIGHLGLLAPLRWIAWGARDMRRHWGIALFYGICFWLMAVTLWAVFRHKPEYTMTIVSGCLLVGPFLAVGLYEVSRLMQRGERPSLSDSLTCWDKHLGSMGLLVLVMTLLELLWGRASLVVFAVFFDTGMPSTAGVLEAVFNPRNWEFVAVYAVIGGIFAALVFCSSVVSIPMILDRDTDAITAALTSFRVVFDNTAVMVFWGALITALTLAAMLPFALGIIVVGPLLGHATWYAYRDAVGWADAAKPA